MRTQFVLAAAVAVALGLSTGLARAGEGNGEPFPFQAAGLVSSGPAFAPDTGSQGYPHLTGRPNQPSSLAQLEPMAGTEAPVHTALSLPRGFDEGSVAYAQTQCLNRWMARNSSARFRTADAARPRG